MSKKKFDLSLMVAGAAMLAMVGYLLGLRSRRGARGSALPQLDEAADLALAATGAAAGSAFPLDETRISSAPDAPDEASDLEGLFDAEAATGLELSARSDERAPIPRSGDDEEAPSADELGRVWLEQATESESSSSSAAPESGELFGATSALEDAGGENDETVREYVRGHRISSSTGPR